MEDHKPYYLDLTDVELQRHQANLERGTSKVAICFQLLRGRKGNWVSLPELGQASRCRCVSALIATIRIRGGVVHNRVDKATTASPGDTWDAKSFYKLVKEPADILAERDQRRSL